MLRGLLSLTFLVLIGFAKPICAQGISSEPQLVLDAQGFTDPIKRLVISNDGRWLAVAAKKVVRVWNLKGGVLHATLRGYQEPLGYNVGEVNDIVFSPDSKFLVVGVKDNFAAGSTRVYDLDNPKELKSLVKGHLGCTVRIAFSPDNRMLATCGCDGNLIFYQWDANRGESSELFRTKWKDFPLQSIPLRCFQFTGDGKYLLMCELIRGIAVDVSQRQFFEFNADSAPLPLKEICRKLQAISLKYPEGTTIRNQSRLEIQELPVSNKNLALLASGAIHRTGSDDKFLATIWSTGGKPLMQHLHSYEVSCVACNATCGLAASADLLGNIKVWELANGKQVIAPIAAKSASIWSVFWEKANGASLGYATENLPRGKFDYNNNGAVNRRLELYRTSDSPYRSSGKTKPTELSSSGFLLHRTGELGKIDLVLRENGSDKFVNPFRRFSVERVDSLGNLGFRLNSDCGEITHYSRIIYGKNSEFESYLFGDVNGRLFEGKFEKTSSGSEFHILKEFVGHSAKITGTDVSPDRSLFASSSLDGTIRIWKLGEARVLGDVDFTMQGSSIYKIPKNGESAAAGFRLNDVVQFLGRTTFYQRVAEIQKGRLLPGQVVDVVISRHGEDGDKQMTIPLRLSPRPDIVVPLMGFFLARDGEWVLWNDAGYYNASTNGAQYIGWHVNNERNEPASFYSSDQFQKSLYQPKVISETFRLRDSRQAAISVLDNEAMPSDSSFAVPLANASRAKQYIPPEVSIVTPARNSMLRESLVSIRARVKIPRDVNVRDARMLVDGRPHTTPLIEVKSGIAGDFREVWFEEKFDLEPGSHLCKLTVETSVDTSASSEVRFEVQGKDKSRATPKADGRLFVLAIGISIYKSNDLKLDFAHRDAEEFSQLWESRGGDVFSKVETKLLINSDASVPAIKEEGINWLLDQDLTPKDSVIIFLSGHGFFDRFDEWYFGGHELDLNRLSTTALSDADLSSFFRKLPTNTIMFIDSCYAGQFEMPRQVSKRSRTDKNIWRRDGNKIVFSSCLPSEASLESEQWQHGAFTKAILDFFSEPQADVNNDGELGCLEMVMFVHERVRKLTGNRQTPSFELPPGSSDVSFGPVGTSN